MRETVFVLKEVLVCSLCLNGFLSHDIVSHTKAGFHMIADDRGLWIADRKKFCNRLRSYGNTLLRSRSRSITIARSQTIAEDRTMFYLLRSSAIVCDQLRLCDHMETKVLRSAIETYPIVICIPTHDSTLLSNKARIFVCSNSLFVVNMAGVEQGSVSNEEFMEEVARYECVYHRNSKEFKDRNKKANCWEKIGEKFNLSAAEAEVKFRNIRAAYGRYLKRLKTLPSRPKTAVFGQPRSQDLYPGLGPTPSQGKGPGNEVGFRRF